MDGLGASFSFQRVVRLSKVEWRVTGSQGPLSHWVESSPAQLISIRCMAAREGVYAASYVIFRHLMTSPRFTSCFLRKYLGFRLRLEKRAIVTLWGLVWLHLLVSMLKSDSLGRNLAQLWAWSGVVLRGTPGVLHLLSNHTITPLHFAPPLKRAPLLRALGTSSLVGLARVPPRDAPNSWGVICQPPSTVPAM